MTLITQPDGDASQLRGPAKWQHGPRPLSRLTARDRRRNRHADSGDCPEQFLPRIAMPSAIMLLGILAVTGADTATSPSLPAATGAFPPFDLSYLPCAGSQGIVALRPATIARYLPADLPLNEFRVFIATLLQQSTDCTVEAADLPGIGDFDEWVLGLNVSFTLPTAGVQGTSNVGAGSPCCLRTTRPYDWSAAAKKWLPTAETRKHAGRDYLRTPFKLSGPLAPPDWMKRLQGHYLAIFVPDDRTIVCGAEEDIKTMLDGLRAHSSPSPLPPAGIRSAATWLPWWSINANGRASREVNGRGPCPIRPTRLSNSACCSKRSRSARLE